jgi:sugar (pentulose or hexulose) kinase
MSTAGGGSSVLVVDVGTSGVRASIVRPDATVDARRTTPRSCPTHRLRAWSNSMPS